MSLERVSGNKSFGGTQTVWRHRSEATGTDMRFSVFIPPHDPGATLPIVWYRRG